MKSLIVEDDFISRLVLQKMLQDMGEVHVAVDGQEAVRAVQLAFAEEEPYTLIYLDIMLPKMTGHEALQRIRRLEREAGLARSAGACIVMTTALDDQRHVAAAFREECDAYLIKPIDPAQLRQQLQQLQVLPD